VRVRCSKGAMPHQTASRIAIGLAGLLLATAGLAACDADRPAGPTSVPAATAPSTTAASPPRPVTLADAKRCPVTAPRSIGPPGVSPDDFFGWDSSHGNDKLWVGGLWPRGVINAGSEFVAQDGSVGMKFGWWRAAPGKLQVTGRRLDAPAPPARAHVPDGYGDTGFQASGVDFPTEGCWEVTGTLPTTRLTFVTFVVKKRA
jgi:hypothetical protein